MPALKGHNVTLKYLDFVHRIYFMCFVAFPKQIAVNFLHNINLLVFSAKAVSIFREEDLFKKYLLYETDTSKG